MTFRGAWRSTWQMGVTGGIVLYVVTLPLLFPQLAVMPSGKIVVPADLAFVALLATVVCSSPRRLLPVRSDVALASLVPLSAVIIAAICSPAGRMGRLDVLRVAYSLCVFLVFAHYRLAPSELRVVVWSWIAAAAAIAATGFVSYLGVVGLGLPMTRLAYANSPNLGAGFVRIASTLGSSTLALYLLTATVLCVFLIGRPDTSQRPRRLLWGALIFLLAVAVLTFSRSWIGLVLALALMGYVARGRVPILWRARHLLAGLAALCVVLGVLLTLWTIVPLRLRQTSEGRLQVQLNTRANAYAVVHLAGLRMFRASPLVGMGPGTFGDNFVKFTTSQERETAWPALPEAPYEDPHSSWIGWAAEGGLVALGGWMLFYGWLLAQLLRRHPTEEVFHLRRLIGLGLVGIVVNGFHMEITHLKFLWAFLGLGIGARSSQPVEAAQPEPVASSRLSVTS